MANADGTPKLANPTQTSDDETFVVSDSEGLQLHSRRNLTQLAVVIAFAAVGAMVGCFLTNDRPDWAALAGGVVGMIVGAFVSGFALMLLPTPTVTMTLGEIRKKYCRLKRQLIAAAIAFVVFMLTLPLIISRFGHDDSTFAWAMCLLWVGVTFGLCVYTKMLVYRLREWKCPVCGKAFGKLWSSCNNCGLSINSDPERAT